MKQLPMHKNIEPFGKDIFIMEMDEAGTEKKLPFYADGFAGIVYSKSVSPFYQQPKGKKLPNFYLCGQTVEPITLDVNGAISIKELRDRLCVTERTLERHFLKEIGVTAKQFAKIIQFRSAMKQMTETDYVNLTEIGYDNSFADQSHFIRSFKRHTGKTPKEFLQQISL